MTKKEKAPLVDPTISTEKAVDLLMAVHKLVEYRLSTIGYSREIFEQKLAAAGIVTSWKNPAS